MSENGELVLSFNSFFLTDDGCRAGGTCTFFHKKLMASEDAEEGVQSFIERRKAEFWAREECGGRF